MKGELVCGLVPQERRGLKRLQGVVIKLRLCHKTRGVVELL